MIKAVLIDDEPDALSALETIIKEYCSELVEVVGSATNAIKGVKVVLDKKPDVVFLDVQMNGGNGFDFLDSFPNIDFHIVFVTAHQQYAIKAIKHRTLDYLLKPVDIDEFIKTVEEIKKRIDLTRPQKDSTKISIPTNKGTLLVDSNDLLYCKAEGSYVNIYANHGKNYIIARQLKTYETILSPFGFIRNHHSYLVNKKHVTKILKTNGLWIELSDGTQLPVSVRKRETILHSLRSNS